jgi:hypothetical protein
MRKIKNSAALECADGRDCLSQRDQRLTRAKVAVDIQQEDPFIWIMTI